MIKDLFPSSADFTVAIFKIPQISKHVSAVLWEVIITGVQKRVSIVFSLIELKGFYQNFEISFILIRKDLELNFETKIVEIH